MSISSKDRKNDEVNEEKIIKGRVYRIRETKEVYSAEGESCSAALARFE